MVDDDIKTQARRRQTVTVVSSDKQYKIQSQLLNEKQRHSLQRHGRIKKVSEIQMGNKASLFKVEPGQNSQTKPK